MKSGMSLSLAHAHDGHEMPAAFDDVRYTIMSYNNNDHQIARWMNGQLVLLWGLYANGL